MIKNYRLKAIIEFDDNEEKTHRAIGEIFMATEERAEFLLGKNNNKIIAVELIGIDKTRKPRKKKEE